MQTISPQKHDKAEIAAEFLSAMANPKRLLILSSLVNQEMAVGALANQVGLSQSALSQHLSKLRAQNLVTTRRDAQTIYYSSSSEAVLKVLKTLTEIYGDESSAIFEKIAQRRTA
ncbi:metalloregulator ArsR/SmtB family transcription factor [Pararhizobium sp. YC-54]|uniref:ArsR/SmtB family transcription factor n=1 Tax=Pararhizobium sp. YC-54 TaxID=2986920 RepID=UPI0021F6E7A1|nr:metalloregulator ArsR/SmtB family transcription factor [Pararhizobium sp. YC-54]MCW0001632.1 metalloregulator ArsR/SmtB family transcription factor [Pararhizobium sp. YC-54]